MARKTPYVKENQYVVVLDKDGNRVCEYLNIRDMCKQIFLRKMSIQYNLDLNTEYQVFIDGRRVR